MKAPVLLRVVQSRPRLFTSLLVGALLGVVMAVVTHWTLPTRLLVSWDATAGLYLILVMHLMAVADADFIRDRAAIEDEGQWTMLVLTVAAALASLAAIFAELGSTGRRPIQVALAAATILLSWAFIHTIFALHYAHEFYDETDGGGLAFPGKGEPDYWDFVYFSFVIGMTSQVSDVGITDKRIRRTAAAHGVVSFIFNAALLALTVNIAASAI
jgi:uncharacterized membrane protein